MTTDNDVKNAALNRFPNSELCRTVFEAGVEWAKRANEEYYKRTATAFETMRETIGHGYGVGDIEHVTDIVKARLEDWDRLTWQGRGISYTLTEPLTEAIDIAAKRPTTIDALIQLHFMLNSHKEVKR